MTIDAFPALAQAAKSAKLPSARKRPSTITSSHVLGATGGGRDSRHRMTAAIGTNADRNQSVDSSPERWLVETFCNKPETPQNAIGIKTYTIPPDKIPSVDETLKR